MQLFLLRHGDVVDYGDDIHRKLSSRGEEQALDVGAFFAASKISVETILTSPLERARRMGQIVAERLHIKDICTTEYLVPGTDERQFIEEINRRGKHSVLCVGHEPQLRSLFSHVTTGSRNALIELRKSSLACIEAPFPLSPGNGILRWLLTIEQMRSAINTPS